MLYELKKLGAALVAALALSLIATSMSAAAEFTASNYPASWSGVATKGTGTFVSEAATVDCRGSGSGTLSKASGTVKIENIAATECEPIFGFNTPTVHTNGCWALVHVTAGEKDSFSGPSDLECPAGKAIVTTAATCETQILPQTGTVTLEYKNNTEKGYVEAKVTASNVTYSVTKDGFGCPFNGTGVKTGGKIVQHQWSPIKREGGGTTSVS
jgi:hypothetical protein